MHKVKAMIAGTLAMAVAAVVGTTSTPGTAQAAVSQSKLENLYVLGALFNNNDSTGILSNSSGNSGTDLGNLMLLDQLFGVNTFGTSKNTSILSTGHGSLGELILLNQLFNNNNTLGLGSGGNNNLGRLFVLDRLFGGAGVLSSGTASTKTSASSATSSSSTTSSGGSSAGTTSSGSTNAGITSGTGSNTSSGSGAGTSSTTGQH